MIWTKYAKEYMSLKDIAQFTNNYLSCHNINYNWMYGLEYKYVFLCEAPAKAPILHLRFKNGYERKVRYVAGLSRRVDHIEKLYFLKINKNMPSSLMENLDPKLNIERQLDDLLEEELIVSKSGNSYKEYYYKKKIYNYSKQWFLRYV